MQLQIDAFVRPKTSSTKESPLEPPRKKKAPSATTVPTKEMPVTQPSVATRSFPFAHLSESWNRIENTTKRLEKSCEMVKTLLYVFLDSTLDIIPTVLLSTNQLREPWSSLPSVLNFGDANLRKVMARTFGSDVSSIQKMMEKYGDIGVVAERVKKTQNATFTPRKPIYVADVYKTLLQIADTSGSSAIDEKSTIISNLLYNGNALDTRYISRLITGKFRLGIQKKTVISDIADLLCCIIICRKREIKAVQDIDKVYNMLLAYGKVPMKKLENDAEIKDRKASTTLTNMKSGKVHQQEDAHDDIHSDGDACESPEGSSSSSSICIVDEQIADNYSDLLSVESKKLRTHCHIVVARAYSSCPSFEVLLNTIITYCGTNNNDGSNYAEVLSALNSMTIKPGIPVLAMLARPTTNYDEILERITGGQPFSVEYKYDGFRAQVHYDAKRKSNKIQLFSRSLENMSLRFPDVLSSVLESFTSGPLYAGMSIEERDSANFVIDGEICPISNETGLLLPFQYLSRREKDMLKAQKEAKIQKSQTAIVMYAFDLLFLNSKDYMSTDLSDRKRALYRTFSPIPHKFEFAKATACTTNTNLQDLLEEAVQSKTEGLIVKILTSRDSWYRPDERSHAWLKLKKDYLKDVGDSFDLVPVAAWMGAGKRTGVLGAYLLASYNDEQGQWETVCQLGTGFSDADLTAFHESFVKIGMREKPISIEAQLDKEPDLWFDPEVSQVWEVKCANLSLSMKHTLCFNAETGQGISLRLPRLLKTRPDKTPWDCTRAETIFKAFISQPERA